MSAVFFDPARQISRNELQRFTQLQATGDPNAPNQFDAEGIVAIDSIATTSQDAVSRSAAGATKTIYDTLSPMGNSIIPMAALLRGAFNVLAPGLSPLCSPSVAMAKIGTEALLQNVAAANGETNIPVDDTFRDYIGLGATHAVLSLAQAAGNEDGTVAAANQALAQYQSDASVPGEAHDAAIHLVNFLSSVAGQA